MTRSVPHESPLHRHTRDLEFPTDFIIIVYFLPPWFSFYIHA